MKFKIVVLLLVTSYSSLLSALELLYSTGYWNYDNCAGSPGYKSPMEACVSNWPDFDSHSVSAAGGQGTMLGDPPDPYEEPYVTGPTCTGHFSPERQVVKLCASIDLRKNLGDDCELPYVGNPINAATGNKFQKEVDFSSDALGLHFNRYYNSILGGAWHHSYTDYIDMDSFGFDVSYVSPDGAADAFVLENGKWKGNSDSNSKMSGKRNSNWTYTKENGEILSFNEKGKLTSVKKNSLTTTLKYSTSADVSADIPKVGLLIEISNDFGVSLKLRYQGSRISKLIDPNGNQISYLFDAAGRMEKILYPDSKSKTYIYNEPDKTLNADLPYALTGIIDENENRYATFTYDIHGRALSTEHANGTDKYQLNHEGDGTSVILPNSATSNYKYKIIQGKVLVSARTQPAGSGCNASEKTMQYDGNGNMTSSVDFNGVKSVYEYDSVRNLELSRSIGVATAEQHKITTEWHPSYRLPIRIAKPKLISTFTYDNNGNLLIKTRQETSDINGSLGFDATLIGVVEKTIYTYNSYGKVISIDGPRTDANDFTTVTYNSQGLIGSATNALGHVITFNSYDASGNLLSVTDSNGVITEFTYHERGWLLSSRVKHPTTVTLDSLTTYTYDAVGQMLSTALPSGVKIFYEYDNARRLIAVKNASNERIDYTLDAAGNRTQQVIKNAGGTTTFSVSSVFDELSRVMEVIGNNGQKYLHQYDANGNPTVTTDGRTNATQQTYDALNRVKKMIDPNLGETQFTYTSQDQIKTVTDARGNTTTYNYDGLGNLISQTSPDTGTTTFTYDAAGNRISSIDARGVVTNYTYDALNRIKTIKYPAASAENLTFTYDTVSSTNKGIGRLVKITKTGVTVSYTYDHLGLVTQKGIAANGISKTVKYTYDNAGNITRIIYPSGRNVYHYYDTAGRINRITAKLGSAAAQTLINNVDYLPFGPANTYQYGNNLTHNQTYDQDYRLTTIQVGGLLNRTYGYDPVNNITSIVNNLNNTNSQSFSYDALNRLIAANGGYGNLSYGYDTVGNRLSETRNGSHNTYQYEANSNRLTGITRTSGNRNFTYDAAGNPIQRTADENSTQTYSFNKANRLGSVSINGTQAVTYIYNPLGQRVLKTLANGTKEIYHYDESGQLIAVLDGAGATLREYIYWGNQQIALVNNGTIYYIHNDHLNTPQVMTNQSQQVVWMGNYEPFGKVAANASNSTEIFGRFPGQYLDNETGLYYNYFRDYDPSIGRYIESDPIGLSGGINTYAYVSGNPVNDYDSLGLNQMNRSPYAPGGPLAPPTNHTPGFGDGFADYFENLAHLINPYPPGSCEYNRRQEAMNATEQLINMVPYSPTVQEAIVNSVAEQVQSNPAYYAGRGAANMSVSIVAGTLGRGLGSGFVGSAGRAGIKASAGLTGFSLATYMALVDKMESRLPKCECENESK